jgi:3-(3-hydroxy-phenyl)propionate hydroxylase
LRFVNGKNQLLAEIAPRAKPFGWPRRNGFVQPLVDAELLTGLQRFPHVEVRWSQTLRSYEDDAGHVTATVEDAGGSATRRLMDVTPLGRRRYQQ